MLSDKEKQVLVESMADAIKCSNDITFESLAIIIEGVCELAKKYNLSWQDSLMAIAKGLRQTIDRRKQ